MRMKRRNIDELLRAKCQERLGSASRMTSFVTHWNLHTPVNVSAVPLITLRSSQGILAGVPFFDEVFKQLDCT